MKTLEVKAESPSGIVASDIAPLEAVFASAKAQAVPPKAKEMVDAEEAIELAGGRSGELRRRRSGKNKVRPL